jgi:hypothetical protein
MRPRDVKERTAGFVGMDTGRKISVDVLTIELQLANERGRHAMLKKAQSEKINRHPYARHVFIIASRTGLLRGDTIHSN